MSLGFRADDKHAGHDHAVIPTMPAGQNAAQDAGMDAWMKSAAAGENHAQLAGEFETTTKMQMAPGAPMQESKGSASRRMSMDGHVLEEDYAGEMMGMPFKGKGITGFDNTRKTFWGVWYDTFGTGVMQSRGAMNKDRTMITMVAEMDEPMSGEIGKPVRYMVKVVEKDTQVFTMEEIAYGEPTKVFEITYVRKK